MKHLVIVIVLILLYLIVADTLTGAPGATVSVPISISDATGLQSLDVTLKYDTSLYSLYPKFDHRYLK